MSRQRPDLALRWRVPFVAEFERGVFLLPSITSPPEQPSAHRKGPQRDGGRFRIPQSLGSGGFTLKRWFPREHLGQSSCGEKRLSLLQVGCLTSVTWRGVLFQQLELWFLCTFHSFAGIYSFLTLSQDSRPPSLPLTSRSTNGYVKPLIANLFCNSSAALSL